MLGAVDDEAAERGEPELAVLVVRQSDGLPGQGWWVAGGARSMAMTGLWEGPEAAKLIRQAAGAGVRLLGGTRRLASLSAPRMAEPRTFTVSEDDDGIRLDRWFKRHMPDVSFNIVSRWARTGQLRVDGKRATPGDRIEAGQEIRVAAGRGRAGAAGAAEARASSR